MMTFIISHDIYDEKRLRKCAKYLEKVAIRIEMSVYLINADKHKLKQIVENVMKIIDEEDDFRIYKVDISKSIILNNLKNSINLII